MKTRKWPAQLIAAFIILSFGACQDWGETDPPAGNQIYPKLEQVASYTFDEDIDPTVIQLFAYGDGDTPVISDDEDRGNVLHMNKGYARISNPLNNVKAQNGVSLTFWVKQAVITDEETSEEQQDLEGAIFSFQNQNGTQRMFFTANGWLNYEGVDGTYEDNNPATVKTGLMSAGEWHFIAIAVTNNGYFVYVDGLKKIERTVTDFDCSKIVQFMASVPYIYLGYGSDSRTKEMWLDDLTIYRNTITTKEWTPPSTGTAEDVLVPVPDPVYFNNFERGLGGSSIVGSGKLETFGGNFGTVFQNVGGAQRTNYLLLPEDVLSHSSGTKELTISCWVNASKAGASADYMWAPLFMAYGAAPVNNTNTSPVLACQYRGVVAINTNGPDNVGDNWCDYTDAQNDAGENTLYYNDTDWLADQQWHLYTAVFTETTAAVYFDGELKNSWTITGSGAGETVGSLFSGTDLKYICLGGNQAWNWEDNDPGFMFDDIAIYNKALSADQVKTIVKSKTVPTPVYFNNFEQGIGECTIQGTGKLDAAGGNFGTVFQNVGGAQRTNYLLLPSDVLTRSSATKELSISCWVNASKAGASGDYMWAPLFMAYGAAPVNNTNTSPVLACQYRGVVAINTNGPDNVGDNWCDYSDAQNDAGKNILYHNDTDWLADQQWHLYTVVFTETTAAVYIDGEVKNSWTISGSGAGETVGTLF
ncbi:MAG: LamG domain-containing protein, partial [Bacteroides sp.]|nr:LamG domain-containing protein [Bacteroides sp.]